MKIKFQKFLALLMILTLLTGSLSFADGKYFVDPQHYTTDSETIELWESYIDAREDVEYQQTIAYEAANDALEYKRAYSSSKREALQSLAWLAMTGIVAYYDYTEVLAFASAAVDLGVALSNVYTGNKAADLAIAIADEEADELARLSKIAKARLKKFRDYDKKYHTVKYWP